MRSIDTLMAEGKQRPGRSSKDRHDPQRITFETTLQVGELLDRLAQSGLYPPTRSGVAEEVLRAALRELEATRGGRDAADR